MKEYLEDKKLNQRYTIYLNLVTAITLVVIVITVFGAALAFDKQNLGLFVVSILILVLYIFILAILAKKSEKNDKIDNLFKQRPNYYVFDLKKTYNYNDLVLLFECIKKKQEKLCIKYENRMVFRKKCGFLAPVFYRINIIKYDNFVADDYQKKLVELNKEYTDKFGIDDNINLDPGETPGGYLYRINFIYSNEFNAELEKVISKNVYDSAKFHPSQTVVIVSDKMYISSLRTSEGDWVSRYTRTLNYLIKWFNIEA